MWDLFADPHSTTNPLHTLKWLLFARGPKIHAFPPPTQTEPPTHIDGLIKAQRPKPSFVLCRSKTFWLY